MSVPPEVKLLPAKELFERARACSEDVEYLKRRLERMESSEGVRGASLTPTVSRSRADVNGTARVDARIDLEAATRERMDADYAVIDYACDVLYGTDNRSGLSALLGTQVADLLWHHYLDGKSWGHAALTVGVAPRTTYRRASAALDLVDFLTPEVVMGGEGEAAS